MKTLLICAALVGMVGCQSDPKANMPVAIRTDGVSVEDVRADVPKFKRIYQKRLDERAAVKITARTSYSGDRRLDGELDQPDHKWVRFDPDAIAEKIIDPVLVPKVQLAVDQIKAMDEAFIKSEPNSFIDENGVRWARERP